MNNSPFGDKWSDYEKMVFTPEEIAAAEYKAQMVAQAIEAREKGVLSSNEVGVISKFFDYLGTTGFRFPNVQAN